MIRHLDKAMKDQHAVVYAGKKNKSKASLGDLKTELQKSQLFG